MIYSPEQINKSAASLPVEFQDAIAEAKVGKVVGEIGKKHLLMIDQVGILEKEVLYAMLGLTEEGRLSSTVSSSLKIPQEKSLAIVSDINKEIFLPLRNAIMERTAREKAEREEEAIFKEEKVPEEENLKREDVLRGIENPQTVFPPSVVYGRTPTSKIDPPELTPPHATEIKTGQSPVQSIDEIKLKVPVSSQKVETVNKDFSIASIKKTDPYREPIA